MNLIKSLAALTCFANFGDNKPALLKPLSVVPHDSIMATYVHQPRKTQAGLRPKVASVRKPPQTSVLLTALLAKINQAPLQAAELEFDYWYAGLKHQRIKVQGSAVDANGDHQIDAAEIMQLEIFTKCKEALEYSKKKPDSDIDAIRFFTTGAADIYRPKGNGAVFILNKLKK